MSSVSYFPELYIYTFIALIIYTIAAAAFEHYDVFYDFPKKLKFFQTDSYPS